MNIIARPYGSSRCYCRPDTTWERENKDFYVPDTVDAVYWTPIIFARISKAGKCIGTKFVERYYDSFNFGILMYTGEGDIAFTSCADHTSLLPSPLYNPIVLENEENLCEFKKEDTRIFQTGCGKETRSTIEEAIIEASRMTSLRIGDYVAAELAPCSQLAAREEGSVRIRVGFCENILIDNSIIF